MQSIKRIKSLFTPSLVSLAEDYENKRAALRDTFISSIKSIIKGKKETIKSLDTALNEIADEKATEEKELTKAEKLIKEVK